LAVFAVSASVATPRSGNPDWPSTAPAFAVNGTTGSMGTLARAATGSSPFDTRPASTPELRVGGATRRAVASPSDAVLTSTRPVAAFLGDSYTSGWNGAGVGSAGWPAIVSAALGMLETNQAVAGTGFVNPGWTGQPISSRVADVIRAHPQIVFVAAGHNDRRFSASLSDRAADAVIARLHASLPEATLVVIGPIWQDGRPPASLHALRDHLRLVAARVGAVFIDPLQDPWFGGAAHSMIGPDGVHPTDAGHRRIASLVLSALRADSRLAAKLSFA
jgi:lysophospholipase L1-like esterase